MTEMDVIMKNIIQTIKNERKLELSYHLCPRCQRAVPAESGEKYCANDGMPLLQSCNHCGAAITSPYSQYCTACGEKLALIEGGKDI